MVVNVQCKFHIARGWWQTKTQFPYLTKYSSELSIFHFIICDQTSIGRILLFSIHIHYSLRRTELKRKQICIELIHHIEVANLVVDSELRWNEIEWKRESSFILMLFEEDTSYSMQEGDFPKFYIFPRSIILNGMFTVNEWTVNSLTETDVHCSSVVGVGYLGTFEPI